MAQSSSQLSELSSCDSLSQLENTNLLSFDEGDENDDEDVQLVAISENFHPFIYPNKDRFKRQVRSSSTFMAAWFIVTSETVEEAARFLKVFTYQISTNCVERVCSIYLKVSKKRNEK